MRCDVLTMFQKIAKHRANDVHRPPLYGDEDDCYDDDDDDDVF